MGRAWFGRGDANITLPACGSEWMLGVVGAGYSGLRLEKRVRLINCREALGSERNGVHPAAAEAIRGLTAL
jgi:hypothetical protein